MVLSNMRQMLRQSLQSGRKTQVGKESRLHLVLQEKPRGQLASALRLFSSFSILEPTSSINSLFSSNKTSCTLYLTVVFLCHKPHAQAQAWMGNTGTVQGPQPRPLATSLPSALSLPCKRLPSTAHTCVSHSGECGGQVHLRLARQSCPH